MKKNDISLIILVLLFCSCENVVRADLDCKESLLEQVVHDFRDNSYFVKISVVVGNEVKPYCISNCDLYHSFSVSQEWSKEQYVNNVLSKTRANSPFLIANDTLLSIFEVKKFQLIDSIANQGKSNFVEYFFENGSQKVWLSDAQKVCVASKLFEWCILSKTNEESGDLVIRVL